MFWIVCIIGIVMSGTMGIIKMSIAHHEKIMAHEEEMARIKNGYIIADSSAYKDVADSPKMLDDESSVPYRQYEN